ncbi:hypothetical protein D9M68_679820 [compost metagenome]
MVRAARRRHHRRGRSPGLGGSADVRRARSAQSDPRARQPPGADPQERSRAAPHHSGPTLPGCARAPSRRWAHPLRAGVQVGPAAALRIAVRHRGGGEENRLQGRRQAAGEDRPALLRRLPERQRGPPLQGQAAEEIPARLAGDCRGGGLGLPRSGALQGRRLAGSGQPCGGGKVPDGQGQRQGGLGVGARGDGGTQDQGAVPGQPGAEDP